MKEGKLRIAMIGQKRIPSREGGIEIVVEELSTRMVRLGYIVTCYNRKGHHVSGEEYDSIKHNEYKGVKLKQVFTINKKGLAAVTSSFSGAVCAAFGNYDVVHFHAEGPCAMLWLPKLFGKRCIATIHGLDHQRAKWGKFASNYIMHGEKCAVKYADEIIVLSQGVKNYFEKNYNRETKFIPNGINKPIIRDVNLIREHYCLEKNEYFLFLARLVPEKGAHYLIEAFRQVQTNKKLVIAGGASDTGEYFDTIKKMAKCDDRIVFTGFVQGQMLDELYSNAYVYVLPSDLEGMPLSLLEAMSYGNCCMVSDIQECIEVIEDKAVIFEKGNIKDLKNKIQNTCDNEDVVNSYKCMASEYICGKYNWNDVTKKTIGLYKKE